MLQIKRNKSCSRLFHVHVSTPSSPIYLQLRRWELCPLDHDYPTHRSKLDSEEPAAFEGWQLTFSSVKCFGLLFNFAAFPHTALQDDSRPVQEAATSDPIQTLQYLHGLKISVWNTLSVFTMGSGESWLLFHQVTGITFANVAVIEGLCCQLPVPTSQACYACKSLAAKHFQSSQCKSGNNNNKIHVCNSVLYGLRNADFLVPNNPAKNSAPFVQPSFSCATAIDKPENDW